MKKLKDVVNKAATPSGKPSLKDSQALLSRFDPKIQNYIQKISDFLKSETM